MINKKFKSTKIRGALVNKVSSMASKLTEKLKVGKSVWENYVAESQELYCVDPNMRVNNSVLESGSNFKGQLYNGTRNPDVDFVNGKGKSTLNKHAGKHGYTSPEEYLKDARNFLEKKPTSTIQSFVSNEGTYFRYDTTTNEFGIINEYGGISTYFKPENGMAYWLEQIEKYAPK